MDLSGWLFPRKISMIHVWQSLEYVFAFSASSGKYEPEYQHLLRSDYWQQKSYFCIELNLML